MSKEEFIHRVLPIRVKLENYALTFLKNKEEAEDIIQEVYIKLWCMREKLNGYNSIDALSFVITKNLCMNRIKILQRFVSTDTTTDEKGDFVQPDTQLIEKESLEQTLKIVDALPSLQQAILKMRHIEGLEIAEIAELTGTNEGAVRTNLSRARNKIRTQFMKMDR